jgi:hypothetical protein
VAQTAIAMETPSSLSMLLANLVSCHAPSDDCLRVHSLFRLKAPNDTRHTIGPDKLHRPHLLDIYHNLPFSYSHGPLPPSPKRQRELALEAAANYNTQVMMTEFQHLVHEGQAFVNDFWDDTIHDTIHETAWEALLFIGHEAANQRGVDIILDMNRLHDDDPAIHSHGSSRHL